MSSTTERRSFKTTHWSLVRQAVGGDDAEARQALAALCEAYWYPLYAYFRRSGRTPHDAEDLTQGFFAHLLTQKTLAAADPEKGRLRTFLLACARNYLADTFDRARAQKRGAALLVSFDPRDAEERYAAEPADVLTPDRLFQRRWALAILERSLETLAKEYAARGQERLFRELRPFLGFGSDPDRRYEDISASLTIPIGTLKNRVFRMRERWRELLFEEVGRTVQDPSPEVIKEELSELLGCV